jgi:hypothetical protein
MQNNTFHAASGGNVTFYRSTVSFGASNWGYVTNGSTLQFSNSRLNFSDYVAWWVAVRGTRSGNTGESGSPCRAAQRSAASTQRDWGRDVTGYRVA